MNEFKYYADFRTQCEFLYKTAQKLKNERALHFKLTHNDIANMFGVKAHTIKYQISRKGLEINGKKSRTEDQIN